MATFVSSAAHLHTGAELPVSLLAMGRVAVTVHDLDGVASFYDTVVGLQRLRSDGGVIEFGAGNRTLIELRHDPAARRRSPREAGLFHAAISLPDDQALAGWLRHAVDIRHPVLGASDHAVSKALYLADPEGNGVEIYTDCAPTSWRWQDGQVEMPNHPLDVQALLAHAGDDKWRGMPEATAIGHVHLQVGAIAPAKRFYGMFWGSTSPAAIPAAPSTPHPATTITSGPIAGTAGAHRYATVPRPVLLTSKSLLPPRGSTPSAPALPMCTLTGTAFFAFVILGTEQSRCVRPLPVTATYNHSRRFSHVRDPSRRYR